MKSIQLITLLSLALITFSCDSEESRLPLGITVSAPDFSIEINENPEAGTSLGTLTAIASDGSTIQFGNIVAEDSENSKFESETPIGALDIDNNTGELTIKDASLFDFDLNTEINATVNATSGNVSEAIAINVFLTQILNFNSDLEVLIELHDSEINSANTLDWDTDQTDIAEVSDWPGVTITANRVTGLDLSGAAISEIPSSISKLSELINLDLSTNLLTTLPESIIELENLASLNVSSNPGIAELSTTICDVFNANSDIYIKDDTACDGETPEETTP